LKKLEVVIAAMESGDLPLGTLLARYAEGTRRVIGTGHRIGFANN
jgi:exonuclease VII small subunit